MFINRVIPINNVKIQQDKKVNFCAADFLEVKNLTNEISKKIYGKEGAMNIYKKFPAAEGISIGSTGIPAQWLKKVKDLANFNMPLFCENLGRIFMFDRHYSNVDKIKKNMHKLFIENKILTEEDFFNVEYLGKGFFGRAYKVSINDDLPLVVKEYKRSYRYQNNHGNYSEQNIAEYIDRYSEKNSNMVKYHYGDARFGIMVIDYISDKTPLPKNIVELDELGLSYDDEKPRNYINQYIIDYGGIITISNLVGNIEAQDIYRKFKYLNDDTEKLNLFNELYNNQDDENYIDKMVGLTHSIKFFSSNLREDLYKKMFDLKNNDINIALVENIKNFDYSYKNGTIVQELAKTDDVHLKEIIAREVRYFPADLMHSIIEKYSLEDNNTIKKYIARNLNYYYRNKEKRIELFDNLMHNANQYASIALINSLNNIPTPERDIRFRRFFNMDNVVIKSALVRNIETFNSDLKLMQKWIDKLSEEKHVIIKRSLCESIRFLPDEMMPKLFVKLLNVKDMNAKEYLAETLPFVKGFSSHPEWFEQIYEKSCNSVKRELAKILPKVGSPVNRKKWAEMLYADGDESVKEILKTQKLV